ncbi:MAG: LysR family transcriptional regulator [Allobaculum sp.]|uniref:LysR family transcriptional regulator n=1 Tax=Allobaculum sp. TaxID=1872463 RepID=UPI00399A42AC
MDLKACQYFLSIIEAGSMNKAAKVLNLTQPTLSRQIQKLEEDLGAPLFERQAKSLHLTREGLMFARRAQEMLDLEKRTMKELQSFDDPIAGELIIGCGEFAATDELIQIAARFQKLYPGVRLQFVTGNGTTIREMIDHGLADLGLFMLPTCLDGYKTLCWKQRESWGAILKSDDPLCEKEVITPEDLAGQPLILPYRQEIRTQILSWLHKTERCIRYAGSSSLSSTCALMVRNGIGIGLSIANVPAYNHPDLKVLPLSPAMSSCLTIAWKERFPQPPLMDKFLTYLTSEGVTCSCPSQTECSEDSSR